MSNLMTPYRGNLLKPFNVLTDVEGLHLYLDKNKNVNTKITANFIAANSEYLSNTSVDFKKGNEDFSFGGWVYCNDTSTQRIVGRYTSAGNRSYIIYKDAANFSMQISNDGTAVIDLTGGAYTAGSWYFVCGVYDSVNNLQKISVNGGAFSTISNTTGAYSGGSANFELSNSDFIPLDGSIDAAFFYNKALSLAEIQALYSSGNGTDHATLIDHNGTKYPIGQKFDATLDQYLSNTSTDFAKDGTSSFSMGCWFRNTTTNVGGSVFMGKDEMGSRGYLFYLNTANRNLTAGISTDGSAITTVADTTTTTLGTWYFGVFIYDAVNNLLKVSLNGGAFSTVSVSSIFVSTAPFTINSNIALNDFDGDMDAPFFYNKVLSLSEVQAIYNSGNGVSYDSLTTAQKTNLVSWWELNSVEGTNQLDSVTASGNDLTPINSPVLTAGKVPDTTISNIEASLVDWWRLNETSGTRAGELGHTLTDNNTVGYGLGKVREISVTATNVADFIAANSETLSSASTDFDKGDEDFSFGCWAKFNATGSIEPIIGKWNNDTLNSSFLLRKGPTDLLEFYINSDGATIVVVTTSTTVAANTWYFISCVYDSVNNLIKISYNGLPFDTATQVGGGFSGSNEDLVFGKQNQTSAVYLDGSIDTSFFYNKALSLAEVQALYANGDHLPYSELTTAQKASLVSYWDLDEKAGTRYDNYGSNDLTDNNTVGYAEFNRLGKIYSWVDQSLNLFIFNQPDITKQPLLTTRSVNSNGIDEFLMYSAPDPLNDSSGILFFSWYSDGVGARSFLTSSDNSVTNNFINFQELAGGAIRILVANSGVWTSVTSTNLPVVGYNYGYIKSTGTSYVISLNGVIETKVVTSGADDGTWFADILGRDNLSLAHVDRSTADVFFSDETDKLLYSNADLSLARINQINSYMSIPSK